MRISSGGSLLAIAMIALIVLVGASAPVAAHSGDDGTHHHDGAMGTHWGANGWLGGGIGFLWMIVIPIVFLTLPIVVVYLLVAGGSSSNTSDEEALEVLRERYARGDIDDEEFETRRRTLLSQQD